MNIEVRALDHNQFEDMEDTMADKYLPMTSFRSGSNEKVAKDVYCCTIQIVNIALVGTPEEWFLVDAGMPRSAHKIREEAEERFGDHAVPKAIILTHGHFDHVGSLIDLVKAWNVPVYAHELEFPILRVNPITQNLTGQSKAD